MVITSMISGHESWPDSLKHGSAHSRGSGDADVRSDEVAAS